MEPQSNNTEIRVCLLVASALLVLLPLSCFVFEPAILKELAVEDGLVENTSAINWLLASLVMFMLFFKKKNTWYLLLGIFFAVCLGEEISWGQRLFSFNVPQVVQENNYQGEFNLHNLNFFERRYGEKGAWGVMHDLGRIFAIFWFSYGCVLPVLLKVSTRLRLFVHKIRLPILPLYIGIFFLINYIIFQYFEDIHPLVCTHFGRPEMADYSSLPVEMREWYESFLFLMFALVMLTRYLKESTVSMSGES